MTQANCTTGQMRRLARRAFVPMLGLIALGAGQWALAEKEFIGRVARPAAETSVADDASEKEFPGGASLKTDPEVERLLERADDFGKDGRYDLACVLWQKVLDESSDTVMTRDAWSELRFEHKFRKYKSVSVEIERTLAALPAEGLKVYRLSADGEAQALLAAAAGKGREQALAEVVRRFFLSSQGDDAAYELACLQLDRHDFVGAGRLLTKLLEEYPDPSLPRAEALLRLAVANARVGDAKAAQTSWDPLESTCRHASLSIL